VIPSAIILAGGRSRRFGRDKALLRLDGHTLLARTATTLACFSDDILVVGRTDLPADCPSARLVQDDVKDAGPLGGLHAGLLGARHELVLCTACDYPFLSPAVLRLLLGRSAGHDAAVPLAGRALHVTQVACSRRILPAVEECLRRHRYRLRDLFSGLDVGWLEEAEVRTVDPELRSLLNVNTPAEWEQATQVARKPR
jgi:molybdopterin-guanine dinucleotide biosynthesis protein A